MRGSECGPGQAPRPRPVKVRPPLAARAPGWRPPLRSPPRRRPRTLGRKLSVTRSEECGRRCGRAGGCHSEEKPPPWPRWQLAGGEASPAPRKLRIREFARGSRVSSEDAGGWVAWAGCPGSRRRAPRQPPLRRLLVGRGRHGMVLGEDSFPRRWGCARALGSASRQPLVIAALADRFSVDAGDDPAMTLLRPEIRAPEVAPTPAPLTLEQG